MHRGDRDQELLMATLQYVCVMYVCGVYVNSRVISGYLLPRLWDLGRRKSQRKAGGVFHHSNLAF